MDLQSAAVDTADQADVPSPASLICVECGARVAADPAVPRLACPTCGAIGYPDRAGRNLIAIRWDCPSCGLRNDGLTNFCLGCGAGLTSKCLRCEMPVYSSTCRHCGSHQDRLLRLQTLEADRAAWIPIQQRIVHPENGAAQHPADAVEPLAADSLALSPALPAARQPGRRGRSTSPRTRTGRTRQRRSAGWAVIWLVGGSLLLAWKMQPDLIGAAAASLRTVSANVPAATAGLQLWWTQLWDSIIVEPGVVDTSASQYSLVFAAVLFAVAALPAVLYALVRLVRRLIP